VRAHRIPWSVGLVCSLLVVGCSPASDAPDPPSQEAVAEVVPPAETAGLDADDPALLPRPFTADQIRDEWVEGFEVTLRRTTLDGEARERWTVVAADADGVDIASTPLDEEGRPAGEPRVEHSTWVELRNHASFPAEQSTREAVTRSTLLGELDGWLYTVRDQKDDTVTEYFFATRYPGAPVQMRVELGGAPVMVMEQIARSGAQHTPS